MQRVAVVGAGVMGSQIAQVFAVNGLAVAMHDVTTSALERGMDRIVDGPFGVRAGIARDKIDGTLDEVLARIEPVVDLQAACASAQLVVEAVPEDLSLKMAVFRSLDEVASPGTILTSNTAGLSITALAHSTLRPHLVLGWHWSQPCSVMRMAEIITHESTDAATTEAVAALARRCAKNPVIIRDQPQVWGFVANRIQMKIREEAAKIVAEGVATEDQVDAIMRDGFRWPAGPFELLKGRSGAESG